MALTLKVGGFTVTEYLRGAPGDGMQPYDGDNVDPTFSDSPIYEGGKLSLMKVGVAERVFPLYLNEQSPAQLRELEQELNCELDRAPNLKAEWTPPGSTDSTTWDVEAGRFEPDYSFRRDQHGWMAGVLRLWTGPYGHTATQRILATQSAPGVGMVVPIPTALAGDVSAQPNISITVGTSPASDGRLIVAAVLPHPSYQAVWRAASISGGGFTAASGAHASQFKFYSSLNSEAQITLSPASVYQGQGHRVLAVARGDKLLSLYGPNRERIGIPGIASVLQRSRDWGVVDLGVIRLPEGPVSDYTITLRADGAGAGDTPLWNEGTLDMTAICVVPEETSIALVDVKRDSRGVDTFAANAGATLAGRIDQEGNLWRTAPLGSWPLSVFNGKAAIPGIAGGLVVSGNTLAVPTLIDGRVEALFTSNSILGGSLPTQTLGLHRVTPSGVATAGTIFAEVVSMGSGARFHLIQAPSTTIASMWLASHGEGALRMTLDTRGIQTWATLEPAFGTVIANQFGSQVPFASVGGTSAVAAFQADPGMHIRATTAGTNAVFTDRHVNAFRAAAIPSRALGARDTYNVDAVDRVRWRENASGSWVESLDDLSVGADLRLPVSTGAIAVLAMPLEGTANDTVAVEIRALERFRFAR